MKRLLLLLAALFLPSAPAEEAVEAIDFIRVSEDEKAARLETALTRYAKNGVTVDLIGAVHIADADYFRTLNESFEGYDAVLFEGIGAAPRGRALDDAPAPDNLQGLHKIYQTAARWLDLAYQMAEIDYLRPNLVHADLSAAAFREMQAERKESILTFMLKSGRSPQPEVKQPTTFGLLKAALKRDKNALKLQLVHTLGAGDDQIAAIAGDSVIVTDRNLKCLAVLEEQIALDHTNLAIFYGAAHFPDMEQRLLDDGWEKTAEEWLTAWDIPKS